MMVDLAQRLEELQSSGLRRRLRVIEGPQGPRVLLDGRAVLLLCSNNYLGLADHPRLRRAAADAALALGTSSGASRLISGTTSAQIVLEAQLARFKGTESALLFGSGYLANTGTIAALAGRGEVVFSDELNHASIIDGCRLSRAEAFVYRHRDTEHLLWGLRRAGERAALIVTDGVFSMDGDLAPLPELAQLARRHPRRWSRPPRPRLSCSPESRARSSGCARTPPPSARASAPRGSPSAARRRRSCR